MARVTRYVDDLTGKEIDEGKGGPVTFALRGEYYEIDLSDESQIKLDKALANFIEHATKVPPPHAAVPARGARTTTRRSVSAGGTGSGLDKEQLQAAREWLRAQGHDVSDRGRIKGELMDLYEAAHK